MASRQLQAIHSLTLLPWELRNFKRQVYEAEDAALSPALQATLLGPASLGVTGRGHQELPNG